MVNEYSLDAKGIADATEATEAFLAEKKVDRKAAVRIAFAVEDTLLTYRDNAAGEGFSLSLGQKFGKLFVTLTIPGAALDPTEKDDPDRTPVLAKMMASEGIAPTYSYAGGANILTFRPPKIRVKSTFLPILIAAAAGILLGILTRTCFPDAVHTVVYDYLNPISDAIMAFIGTVSAFFIFFSLTGGILGMGDISTFNRIGRKLLGRIFLVTLVACLVCTLGSIPFFPLSSSGEATFDFAPLWKMIVGILPENILESFLRGNALQIIFLSILTSVILLSLGERSAKLREVITDLGEMSKSFVSFALKGIPAVVFVSVFGIAAEDSGYDKFKPVYKFLLILTVFTVLMIVSSVIRMSVRTGMKPGYILRCLLPSIGIALMTASSVAAFPTMLETCEKDFGVEHKLTEVGVTLARSTFRPTIGFTLIVGCLAIAESRDVPINAAFLITLAVTAIVFSHSAPGIPGDCIACFALLFSQLGIPADAIAVVIATDIIADRVTTSAIVSCLQTEVVIFAEKHGKRTKS